MEENLSPELYLTNKSILEKTLFQIEKDFDSSGLPLQLNKNEISFDSICDQLKEKLTSILQFQAGLFQQLLYRIDISEKQFRLLRDEKNYERKLAELIVKRELQKVVIREYYKKNSEDNL